MPKIYFWFDANPYRYTCFALFILQMALIQMQNVSITDDFSNSLKLFWTMHKRNIIWRRKNNNTMRVQMTEWSLNKKKNNNNKTWHLSMTNCIKWHNVMQSAGYSRKIDTFPRGNDFWTNILILKTPTRPYSCPAKVFI